MFKKLQIALFSLLILLAPYGCVPEEVVDTAQEAIQVIDEGIQQITDESAAWRGALEYVHDNLPETLHTTKSEISQLMNEGIGATTSNVLCVIDAIPTRMIRGLENAKAKLKNQTPSPVVPTVCQVSLSTIDMNLAEINRPSIQINGYDFVNEEGLKLYLRNTAGQEILLTGRLFKQSNYQYTINISNMDDMLEQYVALVLRFETELLSEFGIIPPDAPEPELVQFNHGGFDRLCPSHIGGDREFGGNGPNFTCQARLNIVNKKEVWVDLYFHVKETKSDWTEAEYLESKKLYTAPFGKEIVQLVSDNFTRWTGRDNDHNVDTKNYGSAELVKQFRMKGDTSGNDVGNCTADDSYMEVDFNTISIKVIDK